MTPSARTGTELTHAYASDLSKSKSLHFLTGAKRVARDDNRSSALETLNSRAHRRLELEDGRRRIVLGVDLRCDGVAAMAWHRGHAIDDDCVISRDA